jgi:ubiquinone/menaquinone biosynthesis C-methylase UbiE
MKLTEKNIREKEFHNKLQSKTKGRFENIFYKAIYNTEEDFFNYLKLNSPNREILDYGCGVGDSLIEVMKFHPKKIVGIDISDISINKAKNKSEGSNVDVELLVDNCEQTSLKDNTFDIVYGKGILHHLNINDCLEEIVRILKPKGKLLFTEPLGTNPIINFYRKLTPNSRSEDEHPLLMEDLELIKNKFNHTKIYYYGFLTLIFFPLYNVPKDSFVFNILKKFDQILFKFKIFRRFAWSVLIIAEKN